MIAAATAPAAADDRVICLRAIANAHGRTPACPLCFRPAAGRSTRDRLIADRRRQRLERPGPPARRADGADRH